jgi:hypothetical protein
MKRLVFAVIGVLIASASIYIYGCGQSDQAPFDTVVTFTDWTNGATVADVCDTTWGVPSKCIAGLQNLCIQYCQANLPPNAKPDYCQEKGWVTTCQDPSTLTSVQTEISVNQGLYCGYEDRLIDALVTFNAFAIGTGSSGSTTGTPSNGMLVRWIAGGGELYQPTDDPSVVPPLTDPYYNKTDDRGISEVKYQVSRPGACGASIAYTISADVGNTSTATTFTYTVQAATVDDDTSPDDDDDNDTTL